MLPELTGVVISLASLHFPYSDQNQINPGIHVELENYRGGVYRNSNNGNGLPDTTVYMGYSLPLYSTRTIRVGVNGALAYGYRSPVIGGLELRVMDHFIFVLAPKVGTNANIVGFALRFPTK